MSDVHGRQVKAAYAFRGLTAAMDRTFHFSSTRPSPTKASSAPLPQHPPAAKPSCGSPRRVCAYPSTSLPVQSRHRDPSTSTDHLGTQSRCTDRHLAVRDRKPKPADLTLHAEHRLREHRGQAIPARRPRRACRTPRRLDAVTPTDQAEGEETATGLR